MKAVWGNFLAVAGGLTFGLACLEVLFRFLPVQDSLRAQPVNEQAPYAHFAPNRSFTASVNKNFSEVNHGRVNNFGFVNDQDYTTNSPLPSVAVIGDSFIEALLVPYGETVHGRLAQALKGKARVYSFGMSRSALPQYLAYARLAAHTFQSQKMVFVIVANDFDESHLDYDSSPWEGRLHYFAGDLEHDFKVVRKDYTPRFWRELLAYSALGRYLVFNVHLPKLIQDIRANLRKASTAPQTTPPPPVYVGNTLAAVDTKRVALSKKSVDTFLKLLGEYSQLKKNEILFVVDSVRPSIYGADSRARLPETFVGILRAYFLTQCRLQGIETIDMDGVILQRHSHDGTRFEFATDNHWNGVGHGAAFDEILKTHWFRSLNL